MESGEPFYVVAINTLECSGDYLHHLFRVLRHNGPSLKSISSVSSWQIFCLIAEKKLIMNEMNYFNFILYTSHLSQTKPPGILSAFNKTSRLS
jgi:hypothetical protein